ncbi:MAG: thiamine pyrophosphate-dependent dehydrogenase E1 component subunit alpha, partial [Candidatus Dormibacteraceae bacterium]
NNLGANAIVGGSAGIATGAALSAKKRGTDQVVACFFGEGALGQGLVYEVMNMASLWTLPVVYVCENNLYNEYTNYAETTAGSIRQRSEAFGIPVAEVDGQDVLEVWNAAAEAVGRARSGAGPSFLHCRTYRQYGHHVGDINRSSYRSKEEEMAWAERDPIAILGERLVSRGAVTPSQLDGIREEVQTEITQGVDFALEAPYPDAAEVFTAVYA